MIRISEPKPTNRCPRCRREGMAGKRHKERPRGDWCSGNLSPEEAERRESKGKAMEEYRRFREAWSNLYWAGHYEQALALTKGGTSRLSFKLREVDP